MKRLEDVERIIMDETDELLKYLKQKLSIHINTKQEFGTKAIEIELVLDGEIISTDECDLD